ncbi:MAG: sugar-transfer associated ATP-grasp domain-containing protein [Methylovirgula sp.]
MHAPAAKPKPEPATVVATAPHHAAAPLAALRDMAVEAGLSPIQTVRDFANLALGPGKVSFDDYVRLRLFDPGYWAGCDRRTVVGQRCNRDLLVEINYRHDWYGLVDDKIASSAYLSAYGLPTVPVAAIFAPGLRTGAAHILRSREELDRFLLRDDVYPLFGKPAEGFQSLGSIALRKAHPARRELETIGGAFVPFATLLDDIVSHYEGGYLFERFMAPHRAGAELYGDRLGTTRIVTLCDADEPRIFRASWKIPSGQNTADNFWRRGNLLAKLVIETGAIEKAVSGTGFETKFATHHPDTGALLIGVRVPCWAEVKALALEGARVMRNVPMLGWDIGSAAEGPVIVEMNETPDLFLNQFPDARGVLEPDFLAFLAEQRRAGKAYETRVKRQLAKL